MIYFDEAGNSGSNLLDKDQPLFLLLSHDYTLEESRLILKPLLDVSKASELHFKNLRKSYKYQQAVLNCLEHELISKSSIYYYLAHKEFMVVIQIVDQLIEPVLYDGNIDIYKGGLNIALSNLIYILGKNAWDKTLFDDMCGNFVAWLRSNDREKSDKFYRSVRKLADTLRDETGRMLLGFIEMSRSHLKIIEECWTKYTLDATLSTFNAHCHFWAQKYGSPFDITFDMSKQIDYWSDMIKFLTESLPDQEVGYGSRKHKYPLLINSLSLEDSAKSIPIQLADILGSSLNYAHTVRLKGIKDDFAESILNTKLSRCSFNVMWPSTEVTPEELDMTDESGINPLDFLAAHLHKSQTRSD